MKFLKYYLIMLSMLMSASLLGDDEAARFASRMEIVEQTTNRMEQQLSRMEHLIEELLNFQTGDAIIASDHEYSSKIFGTEDAKNIIANEIKEQKEPAPTPFMLGNQPTLAVDKKVEESSAISNTASTPIENYQLTPLAKPEEEQTSIIAVTNPDGTPQQSASSPEEKKEERKEEKSEPAHEEDKKE